MCIRDRVTERAEYEFRAMDMGNVMHMALEKFAAEVRKEGLDWAELTEEERNRIIDSCLDQVSADYGLSLIHIFTGGAMMGAMMKGEKDLLTLRIHAGGPLQGITVTADSHGNVKMCIRDSNMSVHE